MAVQRCGGAGACECDHDDGPTTATDPIEVAAGPDAKPLPADVRGEMEGAFGESFGDVRIHTGGRAGRAAAGIQAAAYTVGRDIVFGDGAFAPGTPAGKHLLAHELTHVVQQRSGAVAASSTAGGYTVSQPSDRLEQEAERTAQAVTAVPARRRRQPARGSGAPRPRLPSAQTLLELQRSAGNRAVTSWAENALGGSRRPARDAGADKHTGPAKTLASGSITTVAQTPIQRYSLDEFVSDVGDVAEGAADAVVEGAEAVADVAVEGAEAVAEGVGAAVDAAGEALEWFADAAGSAALSAASALVGALGGALTITPTGFVITIPDVPLCSPFEIPILAPPGVEFPVPLGGGAVPIGPTLGLIFGGGLMFRGGGSMTAYVGPCWLRNISIVFDFVGGHYSANGEWYVGAAISEVLELSGGPAAGAMLWWLEPPIPLVWAMVEGGLRLTLRGTALGGAQSTQSLTYNSGPGSITFNTLNSLQLGAVLEADLDGFFNISVYDFRICEWVWPLYHWETGSAIQYNLPINLGYGTGGPPVTIGPITSSPIPYQDIEVEIDRTRPGTLCLTLEAIVAQLCRLGLLPPSLCPAPTTIGPVTPPTPPIGPTAIPTIVFTTADFPNIAPHIKNAQTKLGKPRKLNRLTDPSKIRKNRREACAAFKGPDTCDEYPFASTYQGGKGAAITSVPSAEQSKQGGFLGGFYRKHGLGDKDPFNVDTK